MIKLHPHIVLLSVFVSSAHAAHYSPFPLHEAVRKNKLDIVRQLVNDQKVDINLQDEYGNTALMLSVYNDHTETLKELLKDKEIDVNLQDINGDTALMHVIKSYSLKKEEKDDIIQALLNRTTDVNQQDNQGYTALMLTVTRFHEKALQALLNHGADVNLLTKKGRTALSFLRTVFNQTIVTYLVKKTETPSLHIDHELLQEHYLQYLYLHKQISPGSANQDLRQYTDILLVNKMLNSIEKEDQKKRFYQACCDAYKPYDTMKWNSEEVNYNYEYKTYLVNSYIRSIKPDLYSKSRDITSIIGDYMWTQKENTYGGFLQIVNHTQDRFLFEVPKQPTETYEALATEKLALSLAQHKIVQDAKKVSNKPLSVIIPLLFAWMKNNK